MVTRKKDNDGLSSSVRKLLLGKNFLYLATINPDGSPQVTPVWVDTDGKYVLVNTALGRTKSRNVERDPRVGAAISPFDDPYTYTMVRGRVVGQILGKAAEDHFDKLQMKYYGTSGKRVPNQKRVIWKIEPERVITPQ